MVSLLWTWISFSSEQRQQLVRCFLSIEMGRTLNENDSLWFRLYTWSDIMEQFPFGTLMKPYG